VFDILLDIFGLYCRLFRTFVASQERFSYWPRSRSLRIRLRRRIPTTPYYGGCC